MLFIYTDFCNFAVRIWQQSSLKYFYTIYFKVISMVSSPILSTTEECGIKVHIGSLIGNELRRQRRPAAWLAQEICCDRTNVYKILRKGSIDTELLCRISMALEHDFFAEFQSACGFAKARRQDA